MKTSLDQLLTQIRNCTACEKHLPLPPRPLIQASANSKILIVGQAPGLKTHHQGVPWDDASGDRLREWLGVSREVFYDAGSIAIVPMGFCYPGKAKSGDLPPRKECAPLWLGKVQSHLDKVRLTLLVGQYSQAHYLKTKRKDNLTETVRAWKEYWPEYLPLPHPSPLNNIWLAKNRWFEKTLLPPLRKAVRDALKEEK